MSQKASPAAVGAFVLGALALVVVAVLAFGSGWLTRERDRYVIYFDGSVQGLDRGAPVLFRGVPVGTVGAIKGRFYTEEVKIAIAVYVDLVQGALDVVGETTGRIEEGQAIRQLIEQGMRAQLGVQSLVTGKSFVSLSMQPDQPAVYRAPPDALYPEIPSVPTQLQQLEANFRSLLARVQELPIEDVLGDVRAALQSARDLLEDPNLKAAVGELDETVVAYRELARNVDAQVAPLSASFGQAADEASSALARMETVLGELSQSYAAGSPIQHEAIRAMQQVNEAARAVRQLSDILTNQPDSVIFGRRVEDAK